MAKMVYWLIYCIKINSLNAHRAYVVCMCSCGAPQPEVLYFPLFQHEIQTAEWLSLVLLSLLYFTGNHSSTKKTDRILKHRTLQRTELEKRSWRTKKTKNKKKPTPEDTAPIWKIKGIVHPKMKTLSSSIHPYVVPDACDFISSVNHKRILNMTHSDWFCELDQLIQWDSNQKNDSWIEHISSQASHEWYILEQCYIFCWLVYLHYPKCV